MNILRKIFKKQIDSEKIISREILRDLKEGDIYIDCGANIGQEIELVADNGVEVYAFEPNPHPFKILQERFGKYPNVHLYQQAVLDKNSKLKLYMHEQSNEDQLLWSIGSSLMADKKNVKKDDYIEVDTIDLAEFIQKNNLVHIKLLKIDIEGAEYAVINKLIEKDIVNRVEKILVETHAYKIDSLVEEDAKLREKIKKNKINNIFLNWE